MCKDFFHYSRVLSAIPTCIMNHMKHRRNPIHEIAEMQEVTQGMFSLLSVRCFLF